MKGPQTAILLLLCYLSYLCRAQDQPDKATAIINFPSRFFHRIQSKTANLDEQLTHQTEKYLQKMAGREERLRKKLYKFDSTAVKNLFAGSAERYTILSQKLANDTGSSNNLGLSGEYHAYTDSLQGMLKFMGDNPKAMASLKQLQSLQAKMQDAEQVKAYIHERKQQISQYIQQHCYNCHSYAWDDSKGDPSEADFDPKRPKWDNNPLNNTRNYHKLLFNEPNKVGDRVIYFNDDGKGNVVPTHSGIVTKIDKDGFAIEISSKWGQYGVYQHHPRDVPDAYGEDAPTAKTVNGIYYETRVYYRHN